MYLGKNGAKLGKQHVNSPIMEIPEYYFNTLTPVICLVFSHFYTNLYLIYTILIPINS